jgi:hypothetical protein
MLTNSYIARFFYNCLNQFLSILFNLNMHLPLCLEGVAKLHEAFTKSWPFEASRQLFAREIYHHKKQNP